MRSRVAMPERKYRETMETNAEKVASVKPEGGHGGPPARTRLLGNRTSSVCAIDAMASPETTHR